MSRHTLAQAACFELDVRKSRFLVHAAPVDAPTGAQQFLAGVADAGATHNCWAYRIGQQYRFADDGEPAGTAGRPILAAIDGQALDCVVVVVTRWFGGIKLGAGGLVRAYGGSAAECLRRAQRRPLVVMLEARLSCDFMHLGVVHSMLPAFGAEKLADDYGSDGLHLILRLPADRFDALGIALGNATRGSAQLRRRDAPRT
jgi:uncharacterized YigZ family protein